MANEINESQDVINSKEMKDCINVECNWNVKEGQNIRDAVSTICMTQAPERLGLDDIASVQTCVILTPKNADSEPCMIEIKLTNNQKIKRIAVVSEATVLEFFKQCGEYASTQFAEFVDEFEDQSVYIGETTIDNPTSEASIKFTKTKRKNPEMWLYGKKLILTDEKDKKPSGALNFDVINGFLTNSKIINMDKASAARRILNTFSFDDKDVSLHNFEACMGRFMLNPEPATSKQDREFNNEKAESPEIKDGKLESRKYIDNKFDELEKRLNTKIEEMGTQINAKLDTILAKLDK